MKIKKALYKLLFYIFYTFLVFIVVYVLSDAIKEHRQKKIDDEAEAAVIQYSDCIGFDNSEKYDVYSLTAVKISEVESYTPKYPDSNSYTLYSTLETPEEQLVYRAYEYAFDHSYNNIFFDKSTVGDCVDLKKILYLYVLDSPMTGQTFSHAVIGNNDGYITAIYKYEDSKGMENNYYVEGYAITVKNFRTYHPEKCDAAYEKASEIVNGMPAGLGDMEKAKYLYQYLCRNTTYQDYGENDRTEQLYDALITGETVCDGFSNALSLLYNLAGIPCCEKMYSPEDENASGHTWDCFCADGVWYNADATFHHSLDWDSVLSNALNGFAFSDKYKRYIPVYAEAMPECTGDTLFKDREYIPKGNAAVMNDVIIRSWRESGTDLGCIITDKLTDDEYKQLQDEMRYSSRIDDVSSYYFYRADYPEFDALIFIDITE